MPPMVDTLTDAFLGALRSGGQVLATYALPLLTVCAVISYYREYGAYVMQGGERMGDALAQFLLLALVIGGYYYLLVRMFDLAAAALATMFQWGLAGAGGGISAAQLYKPSFIMEIGMKAAYPIADWSTWWTSIRSSVKLATSPADLFAYWMVIAAFLGITLHHIMMLIEYHLAVMCGAVLIPWGVWRATAGVAEFSLGWLTGGLIRALVASAMLGIATPLFEQLAQPSGGILFQTTEVVLVVGSFLFAVLCWIVPARAATMAGRASLALTGSTIASSAMSFARFATMASSLVTTARQGVSAMLQARGATA